MIGVPACGWGIGKRCCRSAEIRTSERRTPEAKNALIPWPDALGRAALCRWRQQDVTVLDRRDCNKECVFPNAYDTTTCHLTT